MNTFCVDFNKQNATSRKLCDLDFTLGNFLMLMIYVFFKFN